MRVAAVLAIAAALIAAAAGDVAAQALLLNLSGRFRCVQGCNPGLAGQPAYVTQHGWDLNLVNEAGVPSRAWIDHPGHVWAQNWHEGAVYSPDGMTIQFDHGAVWQRDLGVVVMPAVPAAPAGRPPPPSRRTAAPPGRMRAAMNAFDGSWSVVILTRTGGCNPAYRYGLRISNGTIVNDIGESVSLRGHVWPNGAVRVEVSSGGQHASGTGNLSRTNGSGTWQGEGGGNSCAGVWQATRRS